MMRVLDNLRRYEGITKPQVSRQMGVSVVTLWNWRNGMAFPRSLARLREFVKASGGKLKLSIVAKDGEEWTF